MSLPLPFEKPIIDQKFSGKRSTFDLWTVPKPAGSALNPGQIKSIMQNRNKNEAEQRSWSDQGDPREMDTRWFCINVVKRPKMA